MPQHSLHLTTEQRLQQRLAPMQVRFGRMLEMSAPEIDEEVRMALDEMPALEVADKEEPMGQPSGEDGDKPFSESAEQMQMADYATEDDIPSYRLEARNHSADAGFKWFDPTDTNGETIYDALTSQLGELDLTPRQRIIAEEIIGNIDGNGYLGRDIRQIAGDLALSAGLDVSTDEVRSVWQTVRGLEPAGVGAIDLRDCLLLQLNRRQHDEGPAALARAIVTDYFDLMARKHFDRICSAMDINRQQLQQAMEVISSLNPKPGSNFAASWMGDSARHIVPDFSVEAEGDSLTVGLLNDIPELAIAETFAKDTPLPKSTRGETAKAQAFIRQRRDDATNFIRLIQMRQETLYRVMAAIAKVQREFFISGNEADIKPMILRDIAALTGYDISTVSRATASKYVTTRHGIYPLKMLFNEATNSEGDMSTHQLSARIRSIIEAEDKSSPLSDEQITATLQTEGMDIARRTVAKYREKLGYPVARLRKEIRKT